MSAILAWIDWNLEIDLPKAWRSFEYLMDSSRAPWATRDGHRATPMRPPSRI